MNISFLDDRGSLVNFYEVLNIPPTAEKASIRASFCALIKIFHPDASGIDSEERRRTAHLIIRAYKVLSDPSLRTEYDRLLSSRRREDLPTFAVIERTRVKYSVSLEGLLRTRMLNKRIRRTERLRNFGQDVEVFITPGEARSGIIVRVDLPSRMSCPLCYGKDAECHVCRGVGRISASAAVELTIPPPIAHDSLYEFDLMKARPDRFTAFTMKSLKTRICVIGKKCAAEARPQH